VGKPVTPKLTFAQLAVSHIAGFVMKLLAWTLKVEWRDEAGFYDPRRRTPLITSTWHNRLLGAVIGDYRARRRRPRPLSVLTSASKDGGWAEAFGRRFRMQAVRGSSSRRGAVALLEMTRHLANGGDIAVTPDGPRGPNYQIAPGLLYLAQRTGVRIVPVEVQLTNYWRLGRKWDALWIPKPFSRVTLVYHPPLEILQDADLVAEASRLSDAMGPQ
jgi:lysophospholipid acyltransferase (LPLAT)-like uncharacterized protein